MELKVKIIKEFTGRKFYGELEYFPYQIAFGISIQYVRGTGRLLRLYFGPFKVWINVGE